MKVTFLGTGTSQGVPVIACKCDVCLSVDERDKRLRSSVLIEIDGFNFVIDSGPDFRQQMLRENVEKLDAIIFTHEHKDHIAGLDDIRAFNYFQKKTMDVYAEKRVEEALRMEFSYVFAKEKYPGIPEMLVHNIENKTFKLNNFEVIPIRAMHAKLPVLGFRIADFTYLTDANFISEEEKQKILGTNVLVIDALRHRKHLSHFNLEEALLMIEELKPQKAYLTHVSHMLGKYVDVQKTLPENVFLAYDGLKLEM
jgi:phosphoribosyl 1,2-cyclic phosphate phosphodiesterase